MENVLKINEALILHLDKHGFKKKRKNFFSRKINDCIQHISILETKVRGKEEAHISICIGFTYESVNKLISYMQCEKYDKKWATSNINLSTLVSPKETYGFYINEKTEINLVVENILENLQKYAFEFWDSCDSLEKFYQKLRSKDEAVTISTYALKRPEWNLLALSILIQKDIDSIINEYQDAFKKNRFSIEQIKDRIFNNDIIKESNCYES